MRLGSLLSLSLLVAATAVTPALAGPKPAASQAAAKTSSQALKVTDAYIPEAPPGADVMAAYLTLTNPTGTALTLTGATSADFGEVMMHQTRKQAGSASMVHLGQLAVPAKGSVRFAPGGNHFMLMNPRHALKAGERVTLVLTFAGAGDLKVEVPVRAAGSNANPHEDHGQPHGEHHGHH